MNDSRANPRFGGRDKRGGGFGKKDFNRPSFGGNRDFKGGGGNGFGRKTEMFQATCADCGKMCEVPFRPNGKKPVYCRDCFAKNGGSPKLQGNFSNDFAPKKDFNRAPSYNKPEGDKGMQDLKRQIDAISMKMDKLMQLVSERGSATAQSIPSAKSSDAPEEKKQTAKRFVSKKKK